MHPTYTPPSHHGIQNGLHWHGRRQETIDQLHKDVKYHCSRPRGHHEFNNQCQIEAELQISCPQH